MKNVPWVITFCYSYLVGNCYRKIKDHEVVKK